MARYVTKTEMRSLAEKVPLKEQRERVAKASSRAIYHSTVFLSHSSKDKKEVPGAMTLLTNKGGLVYIDEIDPTMPPYTSDLTAKKLKKNIKAISKFVLLATVNSKSSKWVPWELGIADGYKDLSKIAILPALDSDGDDSWTEWEYMGLYRKIAFGKLKGHSGNVWMVLDTKANTATLLSSWLKN